MDANGQPEHAVWTLRSEFGSVELAVDHQANGPRIRLTDLRSGRVSYLDPLELESIAWAEAEQLEPLLDPGRTRWSSRSRDAQVASQAADDVDGTVTPMSRSTRHA